MSFSSNDTDVKYEVGIELSLPLTQAVRGILGLMKRDYTPIASNLAQYVDTVKQCGALTSESESNGDTACRTAATQHAEQQCTRDMHFAQCETPSDTASNYAFV